MSRPFHYFKLWNALGLLMLATVAVLMLTQLPAVDGPEHTDKFAHWLVWAVICAWFCELHGSLKGLVLLALLLISSLLEGLQALTTYRASELWDLGANGAGLITGFVVSRLARGRLLGPLDTFLANRIKPPAMK